MVALEKGLASGKVGFVEISSARPWPVNWQVKVDGISNLNIGARNMIVPGLHKIELFDFSQMRRLECHVRITQKRLSRVAFSDDGKCQIEENDLSPDGPTSP